MPGSYLLDTNIIVALLGGDALVRARLESAEEVFLPVVALGELYYGARKSSRVAENLARIDELAKQTGPLGCDRATAGAYGAIKSRLKEIGRPIPENDIWIAAIARQFDLILVSRDEHFAEVEGLIWEKW
jgi:tRNA(fMet)-specific endonuclease VapC